MDDPQRCAHERRLAILGEQTATVVHEIRNPLATVLMLIENIERCGGVVARLEPMLRAVREEVARADRMLWELLAYVGAPVLVKGQVDLGAICASAARSLGATAAPLELRVEHVVVDADFDKLREVVINLLRNALDACERLVACRVASDGEAALLEIDNDGAAIPPATLARIFEPFFTTKARGTGLGLPLVRRLVEAHGGSVEIRSAEGVGTRVTVRLPLAPAAPGFRGP
jgi:signal transduction histidine kinase